MHPGGVGIRVALLSAGVAVLLAWQATAQLLLTGRVQLVPSESRIEFFVRDNRGGFWGRATEMEGVGVVRQTGERAYTADVQVRVPARSVTTGLGLRDAQMHRTQLVSERFPFLTFEGTVTSDRVRVAQAFPARVQGRLTLRGVTREVSFQAGITPIPEGFRGKGEFEIRMSEFGIPIPRFFVFVAEDPVRITVDLVFRR
mgnify:FL=1